MEIILGLLVVSLLVYLGYKEWLWNAEREKMRSVNVKERKQLYDRIQSNSLADFKFQTAEPEETKEDKTEDGDFFPLTGAQPLTEEERIEISTGVKPPKPTSN